MRNVRIRNLCLWEPELRLFVSWYSMAHVESNVESFHCSKCTVYTVSIIYYIWFLVLYGSRGVQWGKPTLLKVHCINCIYLLINYETEILHLVRVLPVPLVQQVDVIAHGDQRLPQHLQLGRVDLRGDGAVAVSRRFCWGYKVNIWTISVNGLIKTFMELNFRKTKSMVFNFSNIYQFTTDILLFPMHASKQDMKTKHGERYQINRSR